MAERHVVLPGSKRSRAKGTVRIGSVDPKETITLTISLCGPKLPGPDDYIGRTLSPSEFEQRFSATRADAEKVSKVLRRFGLKIDSVSLTTRSMRVSGTAAAIERAFQPRMEMRETAQHRVYRGRQGYIMIPAELKGIITGIFGLDQRRMARRKSRKRVPSGGVGHPLSPSDLEDRYKFPPGTGAGQTIAIAEFGGGYFVEDMVAYCQKFNRSVPNVEPISLSAPAYTHQEILALPPKKRKEELGDAEEVMLDAQIIAGLCPDSNLIIYFASFDERGWVELLNMVVNRPPVVLSVSWGLAEEDPGWSAGAITAINDRLNAARLLGVTTCVASGDDGSGDQIDDGNAHVDFPSSSPFALGVGGTMLRTSGTQFQEVCWWEAPGRRTNNGGGSTGGGVSSRFPRPAWQNVKIKSLNPKSINGRVVPDVSALAGDPQYDLVFTGKQRPNGGTSASAPLWAALIARIDALLPQSKRQRFLAPLLYLNSSNGRPVGELGMRDIREGNNASFPKPGVGYRAGVGFDAVSGWGVPDGEALLNALASVDTSDRDAAA